MKHLVGLLLALLTTLALATSAQAQTVRGQVLRATPAGTYPAPYMSVTLYSDRMGRSAPAYTTPEGIYYLYNVPPGQYVLEVWAAKTPTTVKVVVPQNRAWTDIAPVPIR